MKNIDYAQAQEDIEFIYACYQKLGLTVDECLRDLDEKKECCDHRDSEGKLLIKSLATTEYFKDSKDVQDHYYCPKCGIDFTLKFNPDTEECSYNKLLKYNSWHDLMKPVLFYHIQKEWQILEKKRLFTPKDVAFFINNVRIQAELSSREEETYFAILEKLDYITFNLPYYDNFSGQYIRHILFPILKQMYFMRGLSLALSSSIRGQKSFFERTVNILDIITELNEDEAIVFIEACFEKAGTTLKESRQRHPEVNNTCLCNHRDAQGNLLIHNVPGSKFWVECERCHERFGISFDDLLGQYINLGLLEDDVYDCFCPGVVEKAEEVLKKADLSQVHSMADFYKIRKALQEQLLAVEEDTVNCMTLLGRLNICLLDMNTYDPFTRLQVQDRLPFAKKEIFDRYRWGRNLREQIKFRLEQFDKFVPQSDSGDKKLLAVPEAFAR